MVAKKAMFKTTKKRNNSGPLSYTPPVGGQRSTNSPRRCGPNERSPPDSRRRPSPHPTGALMGRDAESREEKSVLFNKVCIELN